MGIFGDNKEQKQQNKIAQLETRMSLFGLDTLSDISKETAQFIFKNYESSVVSNLGNVLTGDKQAIANENLGTIVQQNWLIIKLLDELLKK